MRRDFADDGLGVGGALALPGLARRRPLPAQADPSEPLERALRQSEARNRLLAHLLEQGGDAIFAVDLNGVVASWNEGAARLTGYSSEDALGRSLRELTLAHLGEDQFAAVLGRIRSAEACVGEGAVQTRDGELCPVLTHCTPLFDEAGAHVGEVSVARDLTEHKRQAERLARLTRHRALMQGINAAMVRLSDRRALFAETCRIAVEHGRFPLAWIVLPEEGTEKLVPVAAAGENLDLACARALVAPAHAAKRRDATALALNEKRIVADNDLAAHPDLGNPTQEVVRRGYRSAVAVPFLLGGRVVAVLVLLAAEPDFFDAEELGLLAELQAGLAYALEHIDAGEKITALACYDPLTGLPNRSRFLERLRARTDAGRQNALGVVLLDLERYHAVNDTFGHAAGDELIQAVARRLAAALPDPDIVARLAGGQFAIVLTDVRHHSDIVHRIEERIGRAIASPIAVAGHEMEVPWTAGVAVFPGDGADAGALLENAERALANAQRRGECYRHFSPETSARVAERLELEARVREALARREFVLHYQPKLGLASGRIEGVEALVRWNDPRRGLVPPAEFIPLLEETGLIVEVGAWVIEEAAAQYRAWGGERAGAPRIAVNVSPSQLRRDDFVSALIGRVGRAGGVDIEITETMLMQDVASAMAKLAQIRAAGIGIAIDDFGTGYSSLGYLTKLPVDTLKIDRGFIKEMLDSADSMSVVSTIIQMAHGLKLKVVAEGVETEEQKKFLTLLRCDQLQGYLFSRPLPRENILPLIQAAAR